MKTSSNIALTKFVVAAVLFFAWAVIQWALQPQKPIYDLLGGLVAGSDTHVALLGWVSSTLVAAVYYLFPLTTARPIAWHRVMALGFWVWVIAVVVNGIVMISTGIRAGTPLVAGAEGAPFDTLIGPNTMVIGIIRIIQVLIAALFIVEIVISARRQLAK